MKPKKKLTFIITILLILGLASCNLGSPYQKTKMTLKEKEKQNPLEFLSTNGTYRTNLIGEWVIEGTVNNSATIATYKDIVLTVRFLSKTNTLLGSEEHVIYEYFPAGQTKEFKIKTYGFEATEKIALNIESALSVD
jgi:hypothetical protein